MRTVCVDENRNRVPRRFQPDSNRIPLPAAVVLNYPGIVFLGDFDGPISGMPIDDDQVIGHIPNGTEHFSYGLLFVSRRYDDAIER